MQRAGDKLQLCKPPAKRVLNRGENISEAAVAEDIASIGSKLKTLAVWIIINVNYPVNTFDNSTLYMHSGQECHIHCIRMSYFYRCSCRKWRARFQRPTKRPSGCERMCNR